MRPKPPGLRSSSPSMLLSSTPAPGIITPEPDPLELDRLAMPPSASIALTWVVEPAGARVSPPPPSSRGMRAQRRSMQSSSCRSAGKASSRSAFARSPARTTAR